MGPTLEFGLVLCRSMYQIGGVVALPLSVPLLIRGSSLGYVHRAMIILNWYSHLWDHLQRCKRRTVHGWQIHSR